MISFDPNELCSIIRNFNFVVSLNSDDIKFDLRKGFIACSCDKKFTLVFALANYQ